MSTFCLNNAFCKRVSCELSKNSYFKASLRRNCALPTHTALNSFDGYVQRVNQRLMQCFNGPIIYELSMPKVSEQVFLGGGLGGEGINLDQIEESYGIQLLTQTDYVVYQIDGCSFWTLPMS